MDFKTYKIKEIGTVIGGGTPSTSCSEYYGGDIPWLSPKDLSNYTKRYISRGEKNITALGLAKSGAKMMPVGTVLLSSRAPIGYLAIASNSICTNQGFKSIVPNNSLVNSEFLYYYLKHHVTELIDLGSGTTFAEISGKTLENYEVSIPDLETQQKITLVLSSLDKKIELNQQINDNLLALIETHFKSISSNVSLTPHKLEELCDYISRGVSPKYIDNSDAWVLGQTCIRNHIVSMTNARTLVDREYGPKLVHKGDILVNSTGVGSLGRVAQLEIEHPKLVADSHITIVRPKEIYREYLGCLLMSMEEEIENMAEGSTGQTELPRSRFSQITLEIPDENTLEKFSALIKPLRKQIQFNIEEMDSLAMIRDTLLPKLLSGEIDVSTLEIPN